MKKSLLKYFHQNISLSRVTENSADIYNDTKKENRLNNKAISGNAAEVGQFLVIKSSSLFSNNILDSNRAKLLLLRPNIEPVKTGVGIVVASHSEEETIERGADVGFVESWSDKITGHASSSKVSATRNCSFF